LVSRIGVKRPPDLALTVITHIDTEVRESRGNTNEVDPPTSNTPIQVWQSFHLVSTLMRWLSSAAKAQVQHAYVVNLFDKGTTKAIRCFILSGFGASNHWIKRRWLGVDFPAECHFLHRLGMRNFISSTSLAEWKVLPPQGKSTFIFCSKEVAESTQHFLLRCRTWGEDRNKFLGPAIAHWTTVANMVATRPLIPIWHQYMMSGEIPSASSVPPDAVDNEFALDCFITAGVLGDHPLAATPPKNDWIPAMPPNTNKDRYATFIPDRTVISLLLFLRNVYCKRMGKIRSIEQIYTASLVAPTSVPPRSEYTDDITPDASSAKSAVPLPVPRPIRPLRVQFNHRALSMLRSWSTAPTTIIVGISVTPQISTGNASLIPRQSRLFPDRRKSTRFF
jgi:hypothetical protein